MLSIHKNKAFFMIIPDFSLLISHCEVVRQLMVQRYKQVMTNFESQVVFMSRRPINQGYYHSRRVKENLDKGDCIHDFHLYGVSIWLGAKSKSKSILS